MISPSPIWRMRWFGASSVQSTGEQREGAWLFRKSMSIFMSGSPFLTFWPFSTKTSKPSPFKFTVSMPMWRSRATPLSVWKPEILLLQGQDLLCVEHEDYLAVFRCADDGIFGGYGCAVAHHFACEAFIRHVLQSGSQSGDGAGNDGGGNDTFFCGRCCFLCSFCGEYCVCALRRGFLFEGIRRSLQISLQLCLDNRYLGP